MKKEISKIKKLKRKIIKKPKDDIEIGFNLIDICYNQGLEDAIKAIST